MGFEEFSETDVLMNINNGIYTYPNQSKKRLAFDKSSKLLIYDSSAHYLLARPSSIQTFMTSVCTIAVLH